ncbi:MAG: DNA polymerase III subunit gamma/tau [Lachnospiraceae bacterium]|nr:DNA polymerase III subunit gamma/tau [Lachnospiraceae bacterium]
MSSYQALYRKFRPLTFEDVKGQDHIVSTLQNQIQKQRMSHAYLFCGTRGTGKTTIAKIFAKAVNCENPIDGNPCGECESCKRIAASASMNVIEIDAASNNGVDNIREIVEQVSYSPAEGKFKVYIIDEVHMLSTGAFNALLKTLEEPPSYVIFILATTEAHKIPITILSRCQRYDFKRIPIDTIADRLAQLAEKEQLDIEPRALRYLAKCGDGSMRDALSLMDQAVAFHLGEKLTYDMVLDVLGAVDQEVFSRLTRHLIAQDVPGCIRLLEEIVMQGRELTQFVSEYTWYLRNLLLVKTSEDVTDVIDVSDEQMRLLREEADQLEADVIMRFIRIFSELAGKIRYAVTKRILIEMTLVKICRPAMEQDVTALSQRVRELEDKLEKGIVVSANVSGAYPVPEAGDAQPVKPRVQLPAAIPEDVKAVVTGWRGILAGIGQPMRSYLQKAHLSLGGDNRLMIVVDDGMAFDYFSRADGHEQNKEMLERILSDHVQKEIQVTFQSLDAQTNFEDHYVDLSSIVNMEIEDEDE